MTRIGLAQRGAALGQWLIRFVSLGWLDARVARLQPKWLFIAVVLATGLALIVILVLGIIAPNNARFTIEADTEIVRVALPAGSSAFDWGEVPVDPSSIDALQAGCEDPVLDLAQPLSGPIDMVAKAIPATGLLTVSLKGAAGADLGTVTCADGRAAPARDFVLLAWPKTAERRLTLPFLGHVAVGDTTQALNVSQLLLKQGTVTAEAISWPSRDVSISRQSKLHAGDSIRLYATDAPPGQDAAQGQAVAHGLLRVSEDGAIAVTAHATARMARVIRIGQQGEADTSIVPSFWDRFQAQSGWALLIALSAIALNLLNALRSYRQEVVNRPTETAGHD